MTTANVGVDRLQDPDRLESMLRRTGGLEVDILGRLTLGHRRIAREAVPDSLFEKRPGGAEDVVVIATGLLPEDGLEVGTALDVDGDPYQVLDHVRVEDGALTAIMYGGWTHEVEVYRPGTKGGANRGQQQQQFSDPVTRSVCDLMARDGEIRAQEAADVAAAEWEGRFPPGVDLQVGDRLKVTHGKGPERHRITFIGDRTDRWKTPVELTESDEDFG